MHAGVLRLNGVGCDGVGSVVIVRKDCLENSPAIAGAGAEEGRAIRKRSTVMGTGKETTGRGS